MSYLEIEPARAKNRDPEWGSPILVAEEKLNGWRYLLHLDRQFPRPYLTGRRVSVETGFLSEKWEQIPMLNPSWANGYTVLDGEIMPPEGANFRDIAGIMNADLTTAHERIAVIGPPTYNVFDVLFHNGDDQRMRSQYERRIVLERLVDILDHPLIKLVPRVDNDEATFNRIVANGGEGVVLKDISSPYGEGWTKVKKFFTVEVIVTGFKEAKFGRTGKFYGLIGALNVSVYSSSGELIEVASISGMDDDVRKEISANRGEWLGKVVEVRAQEWAKNRLGHPRFVRVRPDRDRQSCTFSKMMDDLNMKKEVESPCEDPSQLKLF